MFEAGFFGTLEDISLMVKGGIENMGRCLENSSASKKVSTVEDDEYYDSRIECAMDEDEIPSSIKYIKQGLEAFVEEKEKGYPVLSLVNDLLLFKPKEESDRTIGFAKRMMYPVISGDNWVGPIVNMFHDLYPAESLGNISNMVMTAYLMSEDKEVIGIEAAKKRSRSGSKSAIDDSKFMAEIQNNWTKYVKGGDDVMNIINDIESKKISPKEGFEKMKQLKNPNIEIDMVRLIGDATAFVENANPIAEESIEEVEDKETVSLEEAMKSTAIGKRLFTKMEQIQALA